MTRNVLILLSIIVIFIGYSQKEFLDKFFLEEEINFSKHIRFNCGSREKMCIHVKKFQTSYQHDTYAMTMGLTPSALTW